MENVKEPASTVDMTVEVFKAMSKASGENIRFMFQWHLPGDCCRSRNRNSTKTALSCGVRTFFDNFQRSHASLSLHHAFFTPFSNSTVL